MLSCFVGLWIAATAGQAPIEAEWLKAVPSDVPVVVRGRALDSVRDHLVAMIAAMSPGSADDAKAGIDEGLQSLEAMIGKDAARAPFLAMFRLPDPEKPDIPDWAVILKSDDPEATVRALTADGGEKPRAEDGYVSFAGRDGKTWYAVKREGWVAVGSSEALIRSVRKPGASLAVRLSPELKAKLLEGDLAVYVDVRALDVRYSATLRKFTPMLIRMAKEANPDQAAHSVRGAQGMIDGLTALLRVGDGLVLNADFDKAGLIVSGLATVKAGSPAARDLAKARTTSAGLMAKLPRDMMFYFAGIESAPGSVDGRGAALPGGLPRPAESPEESRAVSSRMKALEGRQVMGMSLLPMRVVSVADPSDPGAAVKASLDVNKARKDREEGETTIEPEALTHGGFRLGRIRTKIDPKSIEKAKAARPDVANFAEIMKMVIPGDDLTEYVGTDGKLFLSTMGPNDDQVKAQIDAMKDDARNLGGLASWKALRARMPKEATFLLVMNAQEVAKMALAASAMMENKPAAKPPADLPPATALMGFSLASSPRGYDFRLVIPSDVGPVFEKGLAPLGDGE